MSVALRILGGTVSLLEKNIMAELAAKSSEWDEISNIVTYTFGDGSQLMSTFNNDLLPVEIVLVANTSKWL